MSSIRFALDQLRPELRDKVREKLELAAGVANARDVTPMPSLVIELTEAQVQRGVMNIVDAHPKVLFAWHKATGTRRADVIGCLIDGRFFAVKSKGTGKKPTTDQALWLQRVRNAGGLGLWVDDPAKLSEALNAM